MVQRRVAAELYWLNRYESAFEFLPDPNDMVSNPAFDAIERADWLNAITALRRLTTKTPTVMDVYEALEGLSTDEIERLAHCMELDLGPCIAAAMEADEETSFEEVLESIQCMVEEEDRAQMAMALLCMSHVCHEKTLSPMLLYTIANGPDEIRFMLRDELAEALDCAWDRAALAMG